MPFSPATCGALEAQYPNEEAVEVGRLAKREADRMVLLLAELVEDLDLDVRIGGGEGEDQAQHLGGDIAAAREGDDDPVVPDLLHGEAVEVLVRLERPLGLRLGGGELRGIDDDQVVVVLRQ